jgi:UDP-N-acetyl-D-mannosaminuronic acid dehydrogenase
MEVEEAVDGADALVLLVDHDEYKKLDVQALAGKMRNQVIIDTRGVWGL